MNSPSVHMGAVRVAAQLPVSEWRVASAQKLSWAALRGSAGFPGTHACARTPEENDAGDYALTRGLVRLGD